VQCNDFEVKPENLQLSLEPFTAAAIVLVENRDAITRWRDGSGAGLARELAQY
jgi:hypothetical protein